MPVFSYDDAVEAPLDYQILADTSLAMYNDRAVLARDVAWLESAGYGVVRLEAGTWADTDDAHTAISTTLGFPDYYGRNPNALNDCLSDVAMGDYALDPSTAGLVIVVTGFDTWWRRDEWLAHCFLEAFVRNSRGALLLGHRMLCLMQSDDPHLSVAAVGARAVSWNRAEWLRASRG